MIERTSLKGYGERDGLAVVTFVDGRELQFMPQWHHGAVRRIVSVQLMVNNEVEAQAVGGVFWSGSDVSQVELGAYCSFAIDLEREVYRHYRAGKITEDEWQKRFRTFWKIVIKSRQLTTALSHEQLPVSADCVKVASVVNME